MTYDPNDHVGQHIYIGPHQFSGHTAQRIMELGAPVFAKMARIAQLANTVTAERRELSNKIIAAGKRLADSEARIVRAQALADAPHATRYESDAYAKELEYAIAQRDIVKADRDALAARSASLDSSAPDVFQACKKVLWDELGMAAAPEIFRVMEWDV